MKAAANGVLNFSIPDGWWVEGYDAKVGWTIGRGETYADYNMQDQIESQMMYDILEKQIQPLFYHRGPDGLPHEWIARMKNCMKMLAPVFNTNRMVAQYADKYYVPSHKRGLLLGASNLAKAVSLAKTKHLLRSKWHEIKVAAVHASGNGHFRVGQTMSVDALIDIPQGLPLNLLKIEMFTGLLSSTGHIEHPHAVTMNHVREMGPNRHLFQVSMACKFSGRHGYAIRVLPGDADLAHPFEPGLITWNN